MESGSNDPQTKKKMMMMLVFSPSLTAAALSPPQELRERVLRGKYRIPFYMSTDCENLLKKFLILNPSKRGTLEVSAGARLARRHWVPRRPPC